MTGESFCSGWLWKNGHNTVTRDQSDFLFCGISDKEIPTLFEKSRITNVEFRKSNIRTGLGLVICREIIEAHYGTIAVELKVGEGSKFIITLPVC